MLGPLDVSSDGWHFVTSERGPLIGLGSCVGKIVRRCMEQKCVLALIFANAYPITKFTKLKDPSNKFPLYGAI